LMMMMLTSSRADWVDGAVPVTEDSILPA